MNDLTDQELLRDYAERRTEPAFAELVRRHIDLVYSAALRMVRDTHLAEDVAQGVFLALAGNAHQLANHPVLVGWLHRTTQNLAANTVRSEVRRRAREHEAATMNELLSADSAVVWEQIAPHLDAALGELSESDHTALLLRYFQNKSAREMARILNTTEDAAQKRASRAVERLREFFTKRGVAIGAGGLVAVISTNAVQAAPAVLAAAISSTAILAGTTVATTTTATITKAIAMTTLQKTLIVAALTVAVGTGIYETHQASTLRDQEQTLQEKIQALQQQQAPLNEQLQQLQHERDDVTKQLTAVQAENEQWKATQKSAGLSSASPGGADALSQSSAADGNQTAKPSTGLAQMMNDPKMKEYIHQVQLKMIKERYAPLFTELNLTPDDVEKFSQVVGDKWMKVSNLASGNSDSASKEQAMTKAYTENDDQLQSLLGPTGFARYNEFTQEVPGRTTVTMLNNQLGNSPLTDEQSARLIDIVKAEPYTATHGINGELDTAFFGSQDDIDKYVKLVTDTNQRILTQASSFLTPQQLTALAAMQNTSLTAQKLQGAALTQKH